MADVLPFPKRRCYAESTVGLTSQSRFLNTANTVNPLRRLRMNYLRDSGDYLATHSKKWTIDEIIKECCDTCEAVAKLWRVNG